MTAFAKGQTIVTSGPLITVDGLPAARYQFQLVVEDNSGNVSKPVTAIVEVFTPLQTTPILTTVPNIGTISTTIKTGTTTIFKSPLIR